jgi:hypothetical protein
MENGPGKSDRNIMVDYCPALSVIHVASVQCRRELPQYWQPPTVNLLPFQHNTPSKMSLRPTFSTQLPHTEGFRHMGMIVGNDADWGK